MNKNDYISQFDSIAFSPDLEQKIVAGVAHAKPRKRQYVLPFSSVAACILLVIAVVALPTLRAKNGVMTDGSAVETQDYKEKTSFENYLTDSAQNYSVYTSAAGGTVTDDICISLYSLKLTHQNGENLTKAEYEVECERLQNLGYEASLFENDDDIYIIIGINDAKSFTDTDYNFEINLITY